MKVVEWCDRRDKYDHVFVPIYSTIQEQLAGMIAQLEQALAQRASSFTPSNTALVLEFARCP